MMLVVTFLLKATPSSKSKTTLSTDNEVIFSSFLMSDNGTYNKARLERNEDQSHVEKFLFETLKGHNL